VANPAITSSKPRGLVRLFAWRRVRFTLIASALWGLMLSPAWTTTPTVVLVLRTMTIGMILLLIFGLLEEWPRRLPRWLARWVLQVVGVAVSVPFVVALLYGVIFHGDPVPFWLNELRMNGFGTLSMTAILFAPWIAMSALGAGGHANVTALLEPLARLGGDHGLLEEGEYAVEHFSELQGFDAAHAGPQRDQHGGQGEQRGTRDPQHEWDHADLLGAAQARRQEQVHRPRL
jgi:hypothetical protein